MRLSWNEVRASTFAFAEDLKYTAFEKSEMQTMVAKIRFTVALDEQEYAELAAMAVGMANAAARLLIAVRGAVRHRICLAPKLYQQ